MSTREPMWYCHECHAEMRPLMVPDPHCASCNGTFVEKMDNPTDDPREFQHVHEDDEDGALPGDMDDFLGWSSPFPSVFIGPTLTALAAGLSTLLNTRSPGPGPGAGPIPSSPGQQSSRSDRRGSGFTIRIQNGGPPGMRTVIIGGSPRQSGTDQIPSMTEYNTRNRDTITGPLMAQYLLAMLSQRTMGDGGTNLFQDFLGVFGAGGEGGGSGRLGDYVFNQEALDQIITQIMENSNASAPVPATEDVMEKLPREVLEEGSPLLEKDCAVCKEQFKLNTEDPDEQVVVILPCNHPYHEPCIIPWLKSSATCPVCRFQLVPQPEHHAPGPGPPRGSGSGSGGPSTGTSPPRGGSIPSTSGGSGSQPHTGAGAGLFNLFHFGGGHSGQQPGSTTTNRRPANNTGNASVPPPARNTTQHPHEFPGGWDWSWGDQVD
ncbi:hypothetical protein SCP_0102890 [Sparassis crispa]|uniref:RING-type domain-containing protein n=1 Tax=Sparassis crispa TaxID=139825 RepID=A0A401G5H0_9APHY|nr:hypothetical protein SCP_0102890 [Sparassis crispa]GBE77416.1 hypothetical protein SCP_0102890 [Sparassis crispa]